jgi:hypothetical protein
MWNRFRLLGLGYILIRAENLSTGMEQVKVISMTIFLGFCKSEIGKKLSYYIKYT